MTIKPGSVLIKGKDQFRHFTEFRHIIRGANKGKVEVTLPPVPERRVIVEQWDIKYYPARIVNPKGEEREPGLFEAKEESECPT